MVTTEFNDASHYGFFFSGETLRNGNGWRVRQSALVLAALRSAGFLDNMVDGTVPPATDKLWLDKNSDPPVLKEWNPVGAAWEQVTSQTLFGRVPWRGEWDSSWIYRRGDVVSYDGSIWIAVQQSQNHTPAEDAFWDLFLSRPVFPVFETKALAAAYDLAAFATVQVDRWSDTSPAAPAVYQKVEAEPSHDGKFQSSDGAWWELSSAQDIHVEMFGARSYTAEQLTVLGRTAAASHQAFQDALDFMFEAGGGSVSALGQFYVWEAGVRPKRNTGFIGSGHGAFAPNFQTEPKTWEGTNILLRGPSFPTETLEFGVTSMKKAGGWIADPDNAARIFKLSSLSNDDATGTTPATTKQFSIGLMNADYDAPFMCKGFRLCPWIGNDGYSDYSLTAGSDLGDDIDICMVINDAEHGSFDDIQIRGYARSFGLLLLSAGYSREGRCEGNILRKVSAQGLVGIGIRSGDIYPVISTTTSTVTIPWTEESYWPASGAFEGLQNGTDYAYTSLTRDGNNLVFNGVSPNPTGTTQIRNPLRGTGWSTTFLDSCEGWALYHHSEQTAEAFGLGVSKALEVSGFPMRGINGVNNSFFGEAANSICAFFHDCDDIDLIGGKFEIGHLIASPLDNAAATTRNPLATSPAGATANLRVGSYVSSSIDTRLFSPRSVDAPQLQRNPSALLSSDMLLRALAGQDFIIRNAAGKTFIVESDAGSDLFTVTESGNALVLGQMTVGASGSGTSFVNAISGNGLTLRTGTTSLLQLLASGTVAPGAAGNALGTSSLPFGPAHAQQLRLTDGIPAPSTVTGFAVIYVDTADGDLKVQFGDGTIKTIVTDT
ncbi:hypothetical protein GOA77_09140 [Sinorhizobium meliloti]|nr:hypothetical protein [Sinorhizobium meliloti]